MGTHSLKSAGEEEWEGGGTNQHTERKGTREEHPLAGKRIGRNDHYKAGKREREHHSRTGGHRGKSGHQNETRGTGTHVLGSTEEGKVQGTEGKQTSRKHSRTGESRGRKMSGQRKKRN
jgi:hypothetical protein